MKTRNFLLGSLVATYALSGVLSAADYTNTSYYVSYDSGDNTQYALVLPSVNKIYTHKAGVITDLKQVDAEFSSFPTYNNGELCFSALAGGSAGANGASTMASQCYDIKYFYTQKEAITAGTAFMLYYKPLDRLYEGIAGDASSFKVVKDGSTVTNANSVTNDDYSNFTFDVSTSKAVVGPLTKEDLPATISADKTLTADKVWRISGLVTVNNGATLTIEPGTTIIGKAGTAANSSYMVIDKGSKIMAEGTADKRIVFTSETAYDGGAAAVGQWGSLVIIGNAGNPQVGPYEVNTAFVPGTSDMADNSGVLKYVDILNSGITIEENKELNGLSMVGVGSGTTVDHVNVHKSDDDCIEIWGGTVNLSNVSVSECTDDQFDIDDGYSGTVSNLTITQTTGNAGIEMSGVTAATFDGLYIDVTNSAKEGAIYFKKDGIGGNFRNVLINYNATVNGYGAIHSVGAFDAENTSFSNVKLEGTNTTKFTGDSATGIESKFDAQIKNITQAPAKEDLPATISADKTLTADKVWRISGLVTVNNGATLTIEPGTTIIGKAGTAANSSYMVIDKGSKIMAEGTADKRIVFTSETAYDGGAAAVGQWGSLVIIGNAGNPQVGPYEVNTAFVPGTSDMADNSGVLKYVDILNSGITIEENKELNGLSMVGVGSGTTVDHVNVHKSDDDCIEIWGGTVNLSNVSVSECTDDQFDIDDGYSGTVSNLTITQTTGNAGIEMSGVTAATFDGLYIDVTNSAKEGAIYFKKDGIGGNFRNVLINYNATVNGYGAIHSVGAFDAENTSFYGVTLTGSNTDRFTGDSATGIETAFTSGTSTVSQAPAKEDLPATISADKTLTADKVWRISGLVTVNNGATLTIEPGTTIIGKAGTAANSSYMVIDKGSKIMAEGTADKRIVFTSETAYDGGAAAVGQWGSLVIIGNAGNPQVGPYEVNTAFVPGTSDMADNSGVLKYVDILNSGITIEENKELNGLSMVGVGSGTTVDHVNVHKSDDDCIEIWGGTVNLSNVSVSECTDDQFDIDDGYSGTVSNLTITQTTGNAGIEMSGVTAATFDGLYIDVTNSAKEGAIYFKKDGIGGNFRNVLINYNATVNGYGAIHSVGAFDAENTSFYGVTLTGSNTDRFTGDSATGIETAFNK